MWDEAARQGETHRKWPIGSPPTAGLHNCISWRPGSSWVALQCDTAKLVVLDIGNPDKRASEVQRLCWKKVLEIIACAWSENGEYLLTAHAATNGALFMYKVDPSNGLTLVLQSPLFFWPKDVCISMAYGDPAHLRIAVAGSPGVILYSASISKESGRWEARQEGRLCHLWPVCAVRFGPGGRHLAAAGLGGQLCIWDMSSADGSATLELQVQVPAERVTSMAFSPNGSALAVACWGGALFLYLQQDSPLDASLPTAFHAAAQQEPGEGASAGGIRHDASREAQEGTAALTGAAPGLRVGVGGAPAGGFTQDGIVEGQKGADALEVAGGKDEGAGGAPAGEITYDGTAEGQEGADELEEAGGKEVGAEGIAAAYESRLAAIDHGADGRGGWRPAPASLPGQPVKPDATGPTLLEWLGDDSILLTHPSTALVLVKVEKGGLVPMRFRQTAGKEQHSSPKASGSADASQLEASGRASDASSDEVPSGLRILPVGRLQGRSSAVRAHDGSKLGVCAVEETGLEEQSNALKGLAVMHVAGQHVVVCYDRTRSLHVFSQNVNRLAGVPETV